jgi:hypothetical protein
MQAPSKSPADVVSHRDLPSQCAVHTRILRRYTTRSPRPNLFILLYAVAVFRGLCLSILKLEFPLLRSLPTRSRGPRNSGSAVDLPDRLCVVDIVASLYQRPPQRPWANVIAFSLQ